MRIEFIDPYWGILHVTLMTVNGMTQNNIEGTHYEYFP